MGLFGKRREDSKQVSKSGSPPKSELAEMLETCASGFVLQTTGLADPSANLGPVLEQAETLVIPQLARQLYDTEGGAAIEAARLQGRAAVEDFLDEKRTTGGTWATEITRKGGSPDEVVNAYMEWTDRMLGEYL